MKLLIFILVGILVGGCQKNEPFERLYFDTVAPRVKIERFSPQDGQLFFATDRQGNIHFFRY